MSNNIYLYLKTHNKTGLKYLGKTIQDPYVYKGSGDHWTGHIQKHGNDVTTEILFVTTDLEEFKIKGLEYSTKWNIVESDRFANLIPEDGGVMPPDMTGRIKSPEECRAISKRQLGSGNTFYGKTHSAKSLAKMSKTHKGKIISDEQKKKLSIAAKGRIKSPEECKNISEALKGKPKKRIKCPHCDVDGQASNMKRWHFDNCGNKK